MVVAAPEVAAKEVAEGPVTNDRGASPFPWPGPTPSAKFARLDFFHVLLAPRILKLLQLVSMLLWLHLSDPTAQQARPHSHEKQMLPVRICSDSEPRASCTSCQIPSAGVSSLPPPSSGNVTVLPAAAMRWPAYGPHAGQRMAAATDPLRRHGI